jgi:predicted dehydrogenase
MMKTIRVGIVGLGANSRLRHVPGLRACQDVNIVAVCNRRPESTRQAAQQFGIEQTFDDWQDLVSDPHIDAVLIGTWPYLHCEITLASLAAGKHVLTEARMAMNAVEAHRMLEASRRHPDLVTQIVPSPLGLRGLRVVRELLESGFLGELREIVVLGADDSASDAEAPIHWRQSGKFSGVNMLALGILHETLIRWVPDPIRVLAQIQIFTTSRRDPSSGRLQEIAVPDSVHVLTELANGARGLYHLSGVVHFGPGKQIHLYGSEGTLKYYLQPEDQLWGARRGESQLREIPIPEEKQEIWRVEEEFIQAIRGQERVRLTDFETGVRYLEFTEAVMRSGQSGRSVELPLRPALETPPGDVA